MSLLFTDLIKAMKQPASKQPSEARLNELMAQLFSSATDKDEEDTAQAPKSAKKGYTMDKGSLSYFEGHGAREALDKAAEIEIEVEGDEEEGEESESEGSRWTRARRWRGAMTRATRRSAASL
jgi:hypothetical protein